MLLVRCTNYLRKENSDSVEVFSGLVITLRAKYDQVKYYLQSHVKIIQN